MPLYAFCGRSFDLFKGMKFHTPIPPVAVQQNGELNDAFVEHQVDVLKCRLQHVWHLVHICHPTLALRMFKENTKSSFQLEIGSLVQVLNVAPKNKFSRKYEGVYAISSVTDLGNYKLSTLVGRPRPTPMPSWRLKLVSKSVAEFLLKEAASDLQAKDIPEPDGENIFEVENILDHKISSSGRVVPSQMARG